ncbi:MAG TPA: hypothetical protein VF142_09205 [Longimicrobium sp.]
MNVKLVSGLTALVVALAWAPRAVPAQMFYVEDAGDFMLMEVKEQKWENELGNLVCGGDCPAGSKLCCDPPAVN